MQTTNHLLSGQFLNRETISDSEIGILLLDDTQLDGVLIEQTSMEIAR
jgi:hypothetical protein